MDSHIGTMNGFTLPLPPVELMAVWLEQATNLPFPEMLTVSAISLYLFALFVWKISIK